MDDGDTTFTLPTPEEIAALKVIEDRKVAAMTKLRSERDALFPATDKYVMRDYPINDETFKKWKRYRQLLRDLPGMSSPDLDEDGKLIGVEWPTFEGIEVKVTPPSAQEKDLETTRINLATLQATLEATKTELKADLSETKTELKADLSETKADLSETKEDLHTTQTELADLKERLNTHTHPLEEHTHPLEPHTHPLEEHTHPDLVDQLTIEKAKTRELQQRLTLIEHSHAALVARLEALENI